MQLRKAIRGWAVAIVLGWVSSTPLMAQTDTLFVGEVFKNYENLKEGESSYVHYRELTTGETIPMSIKKHTISCEGDQLKVVQEEFSGQRNKVLETWVNPKTLETISHNRITNDELESFLFSKTEVIANPDLESKNAGFNLALSEPTFNFEIDFEFMKVIPWAELETAVISFYHPGGSAEPQYYTYEVEGSESFNLVGGKSIDTWKIFTDYNAGMNAWFWVEKSTGEVVKHIQDVTEQAGFTFVKLRVY